MSDSCLFCKIIAGQIPSYKLYEDDRVLAFLDVGPLSTGHALLIPKTHTVQLDEMTAKDAAAVGAVLPRLAKALTKATGTPSYNLLQNNGETAGQVVMHVHFHLIPKPAPGSCPGSSTPGRDQAPHDTGPPGSGLGLHWPAGTLDADAAKQLAKKIADALA